MIGILIILGLTGIGLTILGQTNVIVRNMKISKVLADYGDGITVQASSNVWIDSCDISADIDHDKDYYDGLIDVVHASEWVTISNTYLHDHVSSLFHPNPWENELLTRVNSGRALLSVIQTATETRIPATSTSPMRVSGSTTSTVVRLCIDSARDTSSSKHIPVNYIPATR